MRERSKLLQLDFQRYPLFQQVLKKDMSARDSREEQKGFFLSFLFYLQLLLQFTVKSCQHCVCLLVSSYRRLNRLFVLSD